MRGVRDSVLGCLMGGGLGDALGDIAERGRACLSDDTQLTLATCESITAARGVDPNHLALTFRTWFEEHRLTGLGSSTLKALRDLQAGDELVRIGGDTDTIASIAGQIADARMGASTLPAALLELLPDRDVIEAVGNRFAAYVETAYLTL